MSSAALPISALSAVLSAGDRYRSRKRSSVFQIQSPESIRAGHTKKAAGNVAVAQNWIGGRHVIANPIVESDSNFTAGQRPRRAPTQQFVERDRFEFILQNIELANRTTRR